MSSSRTSRRALWRNGASAMTVNGTADAAGHRPSGGRVDGDTQCYGGVMHPLVVGDHGAELGTNGPGRRQVDGIEGAQHAAWRQGGSFIEERPVEIDLVHKRELSPRVGNCGRATPGDGAHNLNSGESARDPAVLPIPAEEPSQGARLRLSSHQLYQCRRIQVEPHLSSARIAARTPEGSTSYSPGSSSATSVTSSAGVTLPLETRSAHAPMRTGTRRATGRPRSVTSSVSPRATRSR